MERNGAYSCGMFLDWLECPKCDNEKDEEMDKAIKKIEKTNAKEGKQLKSLLIKDKKNDKKLDKCKIMAKKKK